MTKLLSFTHIQMEPPPPTLFGSVEPTEGTLDGSRNSTSSIWTIFVSSDPHELVTERVPFRCWFRLSWACQIKVPQWPGAGERHGAHCRLRPRLDSCRGSYPHCSHFVRPQRWVSCLPSPKGFPVISHDTIYRPREGERGAWMCFWV